MKIRITGQWFSDHKSTVMNSQLLSFECCKNKYILFSNTSLNKLQSTDWFVSIRMQLIKQTSCIKKCVFHGQIAAICFNVSHIWTSALCRWDLHQGSLNNIVSIYQSRNCAVTAAAKELRKQRSSNGARVAERWEVDPRGWRRCGMHCEDSERTAGRWGCQEAGFAGQ